MPGKNNAGGCKCCCPGKICASVRNCAGPVSGAAITFKQGGTTLATCTTDATGQCCWAFGATTGTVTVSYTSGSFSGSQDVTIPSGTCPNVDTVSGR